MKNIYFHSLANTGSNSYANAIGRSYPTRKVVEITDGFPDVTVGDTKYFLVLERSLAYLKDTIYTD